jgi:asparagine synthase (glutamine-hydrolysing)
MFAAAIWDRIDRRLFLARDRFGEKPLYYGWTNGSFVFASELAALRRHPGFDNPIDRDVLGLYLQFGAVPAPYSIYQGIYKLQPGCLLSLAAADAAGAPAAAPFAPSRYRGLTLERYWDLAEVVTRESSRPIDNEQEAADLLEAALRDAIRLQSVADVPLGVFLSGGIDSSTIAALMQTQSSRPVKTFTVGFDDANFNEATQARAVAAHLGTDHTEEYLSPRRALDVVPRLPLMYSEPFADSSQIPTYLVSQMARAHVTVALSGDGGDEMFGGYVRHLWGPRVWRLLEPLPGAVRPKVGAAIGALPAAAWDTLANALPGGPAVTHAGDKAHKLARRLEGVATPHDLYRRLASVWLEDVRATPKTPPLPVPLDAPVPDVLRGEPAHMMMFRDAMTYLPDDVLHKVDRASMSVSLETRAPFLDHRVAALAWRLPLHMKIRDGKGKWILRQVLQRHVPERLIERPKMGFGVPLDAWLRGPLRGWAEELLGERRLRADGYLDPAPIRQKWAEHLSGARQWPHELWCVLMFQAWLEAAR